MNARFALSALLLAASAASAFAESPLAAPEAAFTSSRSRAQVQAELFAYKQSGVNPWSISYNPLSTFRGTASRAAVVAEYLATRNEVRAFNGEDSGSAWLAQARLPGVPARTLAGVPVRGE
jgi:aminoglycoside phosphotransferase